MTAIRSTAWLTPILLVGLFILQACDSGDPIETPNPAEVAGLYLFEELHFVPDGQGIEPADLLDTLRTETTIVRLSSSGVFYIDYEFKGGTPYFLRGTFEITARTVQLQGEREHRDEYRKILLEENFILRRDELDQDVLSAEIIKTVDLQAYSPERYAGVSAAPGTLYVRLVRQ